MLAVCAILMYLQWRPVAKKLLHQKNQRSSGYSDLSAVISMVTHNIDQGPLAMEKGVI